MFFSSSGPPNWHHPQAASPSKTSAAWARPSRTSRSLSARLASYEKSFSAWKVWTPVHQHPPHTPLCLSARPANASHVSGVRGRTVRVAAACSVTGRSLRGRPSQAQGALRNTGPSECRRGLRRRHPPGRRSGGRVLSEEVSERGSVGLEGIAHELDARERPLPGPVVAGTAGAGDDDGDVTEVGAVSDGRLDADLHRYPADRERGDATGAERDVERGALERGESDLVEDRLARAWGELGQKLEAGRVAEEPGAHLGRPRDPLPGHPLDQLEDAGELDREREVAEEEDAHPGPACRLECLE